MNAAGMRELKTVNAHILKFIEDVNDLSIWAIFLFLGMLN